MVAPEPLIMTQPKEEQEQNWIHTPIGLSQEKGENALIDQLLSPTERESGCGGNASCEERRNLPIHGDPNRTDILWRDGQIRQGRTYDENGNPVRDIDFNDNGGTAPNPHTHDWTPNRDGNYDHNSRSGDHKTLSN